MSDLKTRIQEIEESLTAAAQVSGRRREDVKLVAVTKTWPGKVIREAHACGLKIFGENYVQEFLRKADELKDLNLEWHFIGHLQTNKVKNLINRVHLIHSVDRLKLAQEISRRQLEAGTLERQAILIEVNVGDETSKSGVRWSQVAPLLDEIQKLPGIVIRGLMAMPPLDWSEEQLRRTYARFRDERETWARRLSAPHSLVELSMGTSHDFVTAVECGSTLVRLGTVLFGERNYGGN